MESLPTRIKPPNQTPMRSLIKKLQICSLNLHLISFFRQLFILFLKKSFRPYSHNLKAVESLHLQLSIAGATK